MLTDSVQSWDTTLQTLQCEASLEYAAPQLEGYEIIELIGEGSYGAVWLARETETGVRVAIKRFRRRPDAKCCAEVEHLAKLNAVRGIVALRKVHLHAEPYCYVMEHLPGGTLADLMRREGPRGFQDAWEKFKQLVEALRDVHREGIVHGDIKPDNILLDGAGMPRLCDFGQARGRGSHARTLGTLFYMPPEQARMEGIPDPRWDVYALGALLYEMLTGDKPRFSTDLSKLLTSPTSSGTETRDRLDQYARHLEAHPSVDAHRHVKQVDSSVARLVDRCLTIEFDDRLTDANAIWREIKDSEHKRRAKPLYIFGALAPAIVFLLLGSMVLLGGQLMLNRITQDWKLQTHSSNAAVAEAIGSSIKDFYDNRISILEKAAKSSKTLELFVSPDHDKQVDALRALYDRHRADVSRWTLTDADGIQRANYGRTGERDLDDDPAAMVGEDLTNINKNFAFRSWFNGKQERPETSATDPINIADFKRRTGRKSNVSPPFCRQGNAQFVMTAISCPVAESDQAAPVGLLHCTIPYRQSIDWVAQFEREQRDAGRQVVFIAQKPELAHASTAGPELLVTYHPAVGNMAEKVRAWREKVQRGDNGAEQPAFKVPAKTDEHYQRAFAGITELGQFKDSFDNRQYVGSSAIVELSNGQKLAVIVQQGEEIAMGPLRTLRNFVYGLGGSLFLLGAVFLACNTYLLYRFLRNERKAAAYA
jgi:serine/threonine protein kinase